MRVGAVAVALTMVCAAATSRAQTSITLAQSSQSLTFVPVYVAEQKGYFKDEGLAVDIVLAGGGPKAMTALISGSAQFSTSVLQDGIVAHRHGRRNVIAVAVLIDRVMMPVILRDDVAAKLHVTAASPLPQRLAALKGLRIGITTPGSGTDFETRYFLKQAGLDPEADAQIVPIGGIDTEVAALRAGRIDACTCLTPVEIIAQQMKIGFTLLDPNQDIAIWRGVHYGTLYTTRDFVAKQPEAAQKFVRAIVRAEQFIHDHPAGAEQAIEPYFAAFDPSVLHDGWQLIEPYFPAAPMLTQSGYDKELAFEAAVLPPEDATPVPFADVVDNDLATQAMKSLGRAPP